MTGAERAAAVEIHARRIQADIPGQTAVVGVIAARPQALRAGAARSEGDKDSLRPPRNWIGIADRDLGNTRAAEQIIVQQSPGLAGVGGLENADAWMRGGVGIGNACPHVD